MSSVDFSESGLPIKPIPGSYGIPIISSIKDRLDFHYKQGHYDFFASRIRQHNSTVIRLNAPPGPFISHDPRVIAVLDASSFAVLLDSNLVDKTDVLTGTYIPSKSLYGGFRPLAYLDASDPKHRALKSLVFSLVAARHDSFIPSFSAAYSALFDDIDSKFSSGPVEFNGFNEATALDFICNAFFGSKPTMTKPPAHQRALKWLALQLHPLVTVGLPAFIEELLIHTFPLPSFIAAGDYRALCSYFSTAAASVLDEAKRMGISRQEALHNIVFLAIFNAYGGIKVFFPSLIKRIAEAGPKLHQQLATEIRAIVEAEGGKVTASALEKMTLTKSVVWEALRIDPPIEYQYGRARKDLIIESHEAAFKVKKGEMLFGFQPFATRDEKIYEKGWEFVPDRFASEEGRQKLKYVWWSNGDETEMSTTENKQCPGKDVVVMVGRLLVVQMFLRYDTFQVKSEPGTVEPMITFTSITKASL